MTKIALLVLYNHRYDKNIPRIEELYKGKFSHIYHVVPFYDGNKENVLPVYESSYQFQSYIAQAYQQLQKDADRDKFTHYLIIADDMIINPTITENNLFNFTGIDESSCFITDFRDIMENMNVPLYCLIDKKGCEVKAILPVVEEAKQKIRSRGLFIASSQKIGFLAKYIFHWLFRFKIKKVLMGLYLLLNKKKRTLYPVIWGYSDILILTKEVMKNFCTYSGCFAACNIFVEQAIPTALILSASKITVSNQINKDVVTQLTINQRKELGKKYKFKLSDLIRNYPSNTFFIHPIKLSQWK